MKAIYSEVPKISAADMTALLSYLDPAMRPIITIY